MGHFEFPILFLLAWEIDNADTIQKQLPQSKKLSPFLVGLLFKGLSIALFTLFLSSFLFP